MLKISEIFVFYKGKKMADKIIIYVDMDDTLCDFSGAYHAVKKNYPNIPFPQSQNGFFATLAPLPNAIEVFNWLRELNFVDLNILTAPSIKNRECYSEKRDWVEHYFGEEFLNNLIISPKKDKNKGHFLIDDCHRGKGQEQFEGELIHFGSNDFPDWNSVKRFFENKFKEMGFMKENSHTVVMKENGVMPLPDDLCESLGIKIGDYIEWESKEGIVSFKKIRKEDIKEDTIYSIVEKFEDN